MTHVHRSKLALFAAAIFMTLGIGTVNYVEALRREVKPRAINAFVGTWRLVDKQGRTASYLTITNLSAKRGHSDQVCVPEDHGFKMLLAWPDGFRDVAVFDEDGKMMLLALPRWSTSWDDEPRFTLRMERR